MQDCFSTVCCASILEFFNNLRLYHHRSVVLYVGHSSFFITFLCRNSQCATVKSADKSTMVESRLAKGGSCFQAAVLYSWKSLKGLLLWRFPSSIQCFTILFCVALSINVVFYESTSLNFPNLPYLNFN
jgi:hypothetical protein